MICEGMTIKMIKILHVENYPPHFISLSLCDYQFFHITFQINMIYIYIYTYIYTCIYICIYIYTQIYIERDVYMCILHAHIPYAESL